MIVALIICHVLTNVLDNSFAKSIDYSSKLRWIDRNVRENEYLHQNNQRTYEQCQQKTKPILSNRLNEIRFRREDSNGTNRAAISELITSVDEIPKTKTVPESLIDNLVNGVKTSKIVKSKSKLDESNGDDSSVSLYESYRYCTTTKRTGFKCIETPPVRPINLKFPSGRASISPLRVHDEITVLPFQFSPTVPVNLVFPLEGQPPPQYSCVEINHNDPSKLKTIKIYKIANPDKSRKLESNHLTNENSWIKTKRQGYWLELKQNVSEPQDIQNTTVKKTHAIKAKTDKAKKTKSKKSKRKKTLISKLYDTTESTTDSTTNVITTQFQTEPYPSDIDSENSTLIANNSVINEDPNLDLDKIFMKNKETFNSSASPIENNQPMNESTAENSDTSREYPSHSDKPDLQFKYPDYSAPLDVSDKFSLMDIFSRTKVLKPFTDEMSNDMTTKFMYGHELDVR